MTIVSAPERSPILRALRIGLHLMFALLLALGLVRAFLPDDGVSAPPMHHRLLVIFLVAVLALVYVLGTSREYRRYRSDTSATGNLPTSTGPAAPKLMVWGWLTVITLLWLILLVFSPAFVWVAFPLMFLYLYLLGTVSGILAVLSWWDAVRATGPQLPELASILGPGIGAVLAVLVSAAYRHLLEQALHHQRVAAALRAAQMDLAATEHRAGQLEERERLAREIHDTLAQGFSSILLLSRAAGQHQISDSTRQALDTIQDTASANLAEAREFVRHLATADPESNLATELEQLTARYETELAVRNQPLSTRLRWEGEKSPTELTKTMRSAVLRTVQVALGNVAAHAEASQAVITVGIWPEELTVDIFDDGLGFTVPATFQPGFTDQPNDGQGHTGYGLYGLQQRLTALRGTLTVESALGEGTVLAARIPLTSAAPFVPESQEIL